MGDDVIFSQRKLLKKKAHETVRGHFLVLLFLSLILVFFGVEFSTSKTGIGDLSTGELQPGEERAANILNAGDLLTSLLSGGGGGSFGLAGTLGEIITNDPATNGILAGAKGALTRGINDLVSSSPLTKLWQSVLSISRARSAKEVLFIIGVLLLYCAYFFLVSNVYSASVRRVFLEARVYEKVSVTAVDFFPAVHCHFKASRTMLVKYVFQTLWNLTIVGGFIKAYSYAAVPYIVAENPSVSALEAITLSRKMMDGHKWEMFRFELTLLGWVALSFLTFGISDLVYGISYRVACESEFYARVREDAIRRGVEGVGVLDDRYLYEKADKITLYETYFDVVDKITLINENKIELKGIRKKVADWFGIWIGRMTGKKRYEEQEADRYAVSRYKLCMQGETYPRWLSPRWLKKEISRQGSFSYFRLYSVWTLILLFIVFSVIGWGWEVGLHYAQTGEISNRGTMLGPWIPIYGSGGIIALCLCTRFRKHPVLEFIFSVILCGTLEYFAGWMLETRFHRRWWSYDGYFLNLHGRICAEGLLVFGIACCLTVYLIAPIFDYLVSKLPQKVLVTVTVVLAGLFMVDAVHSSFHPNMSKGAVEEEIMPASGNGAAESSAAAGESAAAAAQSISAGAASQSVSAAAAGLSVSSFDLIANLL